MAGRKPLTEEEKAARDQEKQSLFADRRKYNRKKTTDQTDITNKPMAEETENTQNQNQEGQSNETASTENNAGENQSSVTENTNTSHLSTPTWKPFKGNRIHRDYSTPVINENLANTEIPEAPITVEETVSTQSAEELLNKPLTDTNLGQNTSKSNAGPTTTVPEKPTPINSDWDKMTPGEQQIAAEAAADMMIGVYDKLHYFGREYIKVDEEEIIEMHNDDKIDMHAATVENDDDPEKEVTIQEFWQDFNKQVDDRFIVTDTFKSKIRPPLVRLCAKHGLGASDGMQVAFYAGEDAATKIAMLVGFKKTVNKMNEHFMKNHSKFKAAVEAEVQARIAAQEKKNNPNGNNNNNSTSNNQESQTSNTGELKNDQKQETPVIDEGGTKK